MDGLSPLLHCRLHTGKSTGPQCLGSLAFLADDAKLLTDRMSQPSIRGSGLSPAIAWMPSLSKEASRQSSWLTSKRWSLGKAPMTSAQPCASFMPIAHDFSASSRGHHLLIEDSMTKQLA